MEVSVWGTYPQSPEARVVRITVYLEGGPGSPELTLYPTKHASGIPWAWVEWLPSLGSFQIWGGPMPRNYPHAGTYSLPPSLLLALRPNEFHQVCIAYVMPSSIKYHYLEINGTAA